MDQLKIGTKVRVVKSGEMLHLHTVGVICSSLNPRDNTYMVMVDNTATANVGADALAIHRGNQLVNVYEKDNEIQDILYALVGGGQSSFTGSIDDCIEYAKELGLTHYRVVNRKTAIVAYVA